MVQIAENRISSSTSSTNRFAIRPERRIRDSVTPRIGPKNAKTQIANELASELWSRLPISRLVDETGHRSIEQIIRVANSSHSQIVSRHQELRQWVMAICHAAIEIRGDEEVSEQFRNELVLEIKEQTVADELFALPPRNFIDYRFADLAPAAALEKAGRELEKFCLHLAN